VFIFFSQLRPYFVILQIAFHFCQGLGRPARHGLKLAEVVELEEILMDSMHVQLHGLVFLGQSAKN